MRREYYDVIVIGSGGGGLFAAALLTQGGYRTLVVERLPRIGGRASSRTYKGFQLTTGAIAVERGGIIEQIFSEISAKFEVRSAGLNFHRIGGKDYEMPKKGALRITLNLASGNEEETERVMRAVRRGRSWQAPSDSISFREWLLQYTQNEVILKTFGKLLSFSQLIFDHELPAGEYFRYVEAGRIPDFGFALGGNLGLWESLARAIQAKGSEVWTGCQARQIIVADGQAKGAIVQKGDDVVEVMAKAVISNAGPKKTVELVGDENFDKGYLKQLKEKLRPVPGILIQVASDRPLIECGSLYLPEARRVFQICCPTLVCPEVAPRGKHLLVSEGGLGSSLPPYHFKQERDLHIQDLRDNLPGFDRYAEVLAVTYFRQDWPVYRSWPGYDLPQKTPIENLYNVGDGVKPSGWTGLRACAQSARIVADDIKRRFEPGKAL